MAEDPAETVAKMRARLYRSLYGRSHGMGASTSDDSDTAGGYQTNEVKPYIPPTEFADNDALPYGNVVGAPLG